MEKNIGSIYHIIRYHCPQSPRCQEMEDKKMLEQLRSRVAKRQKGAWGYKRMEVCEFSAFTMMIYI